METIATHQGIVTSVEEGRLRVRILRLSGCASCAAHSRCQLSEQKETDIDVPVSAFTDGHTYKVGDTVTVAVGSSRGLLAVLLAYILPAVLLVGVFTACHLSGLSEPVSALITIGAVALYALLLFLLRGKLDRKFQFRLLNS